MIGEFVAHVSSPRFRGLNHDPTADLNELSTRRFLRSRSLFGQTGGHPADKTGWIGRKWPKRTFSTCPVLGPKSNFLAPLTRASSVRTSQSVGTGDQQGIDVLGAAAGKAPGVSMKADPRA